MAKTTTEVPVKDTATTTAGTTIKNFKTASEVTDFYRFINDNKLRAEAREIISVVLKKITPAKKRGRKKAKKTLQ